MFKKVAGAFEVLGDPQKRAQYDHLRGKPRHLWRGQERGRRSRPCFTVNAEFFVARYIGE